MTAHDPKIYLGSSCHVIFNNDGTVTLQDTGDISAYDGLQTDHIPGLAEVRSAHSAVLFRYLERWGIPTAFIRKLSPAEILQWVGEMIKIEFVLRRRLDIGSYQQYRYPKNRIKRSKKLVRELFAKQALDLRDRQQPKMIDGNVLRAELLEAAGGDRDRAKALLKSLYDTKQVFADPLVVQNGDDWLIYDAKAEFRDEDYLHRIAAPVDRETIEACWELAERVFVALEDGIAKMDLSKTGLQQRPELGDLKVEFAKLPDGRLVLADKVDGDSWRLIEETPKGVVSRLSKDPYRKKQVGKEGLVEVYRTTLRVIEQMAA